jgi:hypothetical protein
MAIRYHYGLADVKLAPLVADGIWGTAVDVGAVQMYGITYNLQTAELEGDDIIVDSHSKPIKATIRLRFGFSGLAVLAAITGKARDVYTNYEMWSLGRDNMGYFGMNGSISATEGGGDLQFFVPKVKVMSDIPLEAQYGGYVVPEITATAHYSGTMWEIAKMVVNNTVTAVTIPPTFATA